jgi:ferredoxin
MCATVCPSGALYYGPREYIEKFRREEAVNEFQFGRQTVRTKVNMMTSPELKALPFDVLDFLPWEDKDFDPFALARQRAGAPDAADAAVWDEATVGSPSRCSGNCTCH